VHIFEYLKQFTRFLFFSTIKSIKPIDTKTADVLEIRYDIHGNKESYKSQYSLKVTRFKIDDQVIVERNFLKAAWIRFICD
jgi:hypothetical protein